MKKQCLRSIIFLALTLSLPSLAADVCGSLERSDGFGPYDYRDSEAKLKKLPIVERYHFTENVKQFRKENDILPGNHLDFTLRAFPNHAPALQLMVTLAERDKTTQPHGARYTVECYFDRAIRFRPEDVSMHLLYGIFLAKKGQPDKALEAYATAEKLQPNNSNLHYNRGLLYFDQKKYDKALEEAHLAYELGFPLAGLKNKLQKAGKWQEKPAEAEKEVRTESK